MEFFCTWNIREPCTCEPSQEHDARNNHIVIVVAMDSNGRFFESWTTDTDLEAIEQNLTPISELDADLTLHFANQQGWEVEFRQLCPERIMRDAS